MIFKIKWENIMALMLFGATIYAWYGYAQMPEEVRMLALACMMTFSLILVLISHDTIEMFRQEIIKSWK